MRPTKLAELDDSPSIATPFSSSPCSYTEYLYTGKDFHTCGLRSIFKHTMLSAGLFEYW